MFLCFYKGPQIIKHRFRRALKLDFFQSLYLTRSFFNFWLILDQFWPPESLRRSANPRSLRRQSSIRRPKELLQLPKAPSIVSWPILDWFCLDFWSILHWFFIQPGLPSTNPSTNQSLNQPTLQPTNLSTNQPFNQPTFQPTNPSTSQPFNQPTPQPTNPSTKKPLNPPTLQHTNPSTNTPFNQPALQPTNPSTNQTNL